MAMESPGIDFTLGLTLAGKVHLHDITNTYSILSHVSAQPLLETRRGSNMLCVL